jgi:hypothetical protein
VAGSISFLFGLIAHFLVTFFWGMFLGRLSALVFPRRLHGLWLVPVLLVLVGMMGVVTLNCGLWYRMGFGEVRLEDSLCSASIPMMVAVIMWAVSPRMKAVRYFSCVKCGYDIHATLVSPRCPECGHVLLIGEDYPYLPQHVEALESFGNAGSSIEEEEE